MPGGDETDSWWGHQFINSRTCLATAPEANVMLTVHSNRQIKKGEHPRSINPVKIITVNNKFMSQNAWALSLTPEFLQMELGPGALSSLRTRTREQGEGARPQGHNASAFIFSSPNEFVGTEGGKLYRRSLG